LCNNLLPAVIICARQYPIRGLPNEAQNSRFTVCNSVCHSVFDKAVRL
jgi:hypothetical protein